MLPIDELLLSDFEMYLPISLALYPTQIVPHVHASFPACPRITRAVPGHEHRAPSIVVWPIQTKHRVRVRVRVRVRASVRVRMRVMVRVMVRLRAMLFV